MNLKSCLVLAASMLAAATSMANDALKPEEIKTLMVGKKITFRLNGMLNDFQMNPDGTSATSAAGGDTGKWRFSADGYCVAWTKIRGGQEACFKVAKTGFAHSIIGPDGSIATIVRLD